MSNFTDFIGTRMSGIWIKLKSSLWFFPTIIVLLFSLAAVVMIGLDIVYADVISEGKFYLLQTSAEGARGILTTIASSMITVAGVVFSITIVALSLASSQYSSRILKNFMRDHNNQVVLGVFVGIFAYCLLVLRSIRGSEHAEFIPNLSVFFALIISFLGIAIFVFFIHHIASSIQASRIITNIYKETMNVIRKLYPDEIKEGEEKVLKTENNKLENIPDYYPVYSNYTGYIQKIDIRVLDKIAKKYDLFIRIEVPIGSFLFDMVPYIFVKSKKEPDDELITLLRNAFTIESQRTIEQDPAYGIRQIVDTALKAISPGINDTTTAVMCIQHLSAILCRLAKLKLYDSMNNGNDKERVIVSQHDFKFYIDEAFNQIRQHGKNNITILRMLAWGYENINSCILMPERKEIINKHMESLLETVETNIDPGNEKDLLKKMCRIT